MKQELVGVVLAGGIGSRFWPLTGDKIMFPFMGKPLFEYSVLSCIPAGLSRLVIVANSQNAEFLKSYQYPIPAVVIEQKHAGGMADALMTVSEYIQNASLLIFIADHIVSSSVYAKALDASQLGNPFGILPGWRTDAYFPGGYLKLDGEKVTGIVEKPKPGTQPSPYVYVSGVFFEDASVLLSRLVQSNSSEDNVFELAVSELARTMDIRMIPYTGVSSSLKYPWHVLDINRILLETQLTAGRGAGVDIKNFVTIEGPVYLGKNVKIFEYSKIIGPCYIGDNTIIGNNVMIRESHIGSDCVVGFQTEVARSYVGNGCWFHSNYIGDSVIEGNVSFGAGSVLANLRFDESQIHTEVKQQRISSGKNKFGAVIASGVRFGVNVSIMPGVKIGSNTCIGAGSVIQKDIAAGTFVGMKSEMIQKTNTVRSSTDTRIEFRNSMN